MSNPSENLLRINTLVRAKNNEFHCSICTNDANFSAWQQHVSDAKHVAALEKFNLIFESRSQNALCKLCNKDFDWSAIRTHGKSHHNALWQNPDDKYRLFFENHIVEFNNKFYCCNCDIILLDSSVALVHSQRDKTHQKHVEKIAPLSQIPASIPASETHKSLVSEGFVPRDDTRLECIFCKQDSIEFHRITEHVKGFSHRHYKIQFAPGSHETKDEELDAKAVSKNVQSLESLPGQRLPCPYFERVNERIFLCKVCTCFVQALEESIKFHTEGKVHMESLKKYGCDKISLKDGDTYYCSCCNVSIPDSKSLHIHIKEQSHMASMLKSVTSQNVPYDYIVKLTSRESYCKVCEMKLLGETIAKHAAESGHAAALEKYGCDKISLKDGNTYYCSCCNVSIPDSKSLHIHIKEQSHMASMLKSVTSENVPYNYIVKLTSRESYCKICEMKLLGETIAKHAAESGHAAALEKYGCDGISQQEGHNCWCKYCQCRIPGLDNIYLHLRGRRHTFSMIAIRKLQQEEKAKKKAEEAKSERPEWSQALSLMMNELTKLSEQLKPKPKPKKSRAIANQAFNEVVEPTACHFCNAVVTSGAELHSHMAAHFTMEFVHFRVDQNTNKINPSPEEVHESNAESVNTAPVNLTETKAPTDIPKAEHDENSSDSTLNNLTAKSSSIISSYTSDSENSSDSSEMRRLPKKTLVQKIAKLLDFDKDYIYDMKEKLREIELGMKLCMVVDEKSVYCLICRKTVHNTLQNYFEHLGSLDHSEYLEGMEKDHALFEIVTGQFSELDLAYQFMEETSLELVRCLICSKEVPDVEYALQDHIQEKNHETIRDQLHKMAKEGFEDIRLRMQCDWYNVQKYWCVPCSANFETEVNFVKHLESSKHAGVANKWENIDRTMMYDYCAPCALLWYGYRCTYAYHCDVPSHKWLLRDGHYSQPGLPELAANLLNTPEQFVDDTIGFLDRVAGKEREKEQALVDDLVNAVKTKFFRAKAYVYGSRATGLGSPDSDIDVFLDCGSRYDGNMKSERILLNLMSGVHKCLTKDSQSWDVNELLTECRSPVIRANHRATGLSCDITVENGLSVENTKLVKSFVENFPPCRKLILFLKQWLAFCNLSGSDRISSYALYWYVIFYMQKESILPSVSTLIAMNKKSHLIADWEVGVTHEFSYNEAQSNYSLKEFLIRFFTFYADFDFRYDVACPLLGEVIKKRTFADHRRLPKEMAPYIAYAKRSDDPEPLRVDSPMCIQDPFDLQHNITKAVSKVFLCRFRTYCSKSLDLLCK